MFFFLFCSQQVHLIRMILDYAAERIDKNGAKDVGHILKSLRLANSDVGVMELALKQSPQSIKEFKELHFTEKNSVTGVLYHNKKIAFGKKYDEAKTNHKSDSELIRLRMKDPGLGFPEMYCNSTVTERTKQLALGAVSRDGQLINHLKQCCLFTDPDIVAAALNCRCQSVQDTERVMHCMTLDQLQVGRSNHTVRALTNYLMDHPSCMVELCSKYYKHNQQNVSSSLLSEEALLQVVRSNPSNPRRCRRTLRCDELLEWEKGDQNQITNEKLRKKVTSITGDTRIVRLTRISSGDAPLDYASRTCVYGGEEVSGWVVSVHENVWQLSCV